MRATTERGLGRGLAAILPGAAERERRQLAPRDRLAEQVVERCLDSLDALAAVVPTPAIAVVERVVGDPLVLTRRPALTELAPSRVYTLVATLARSIDAARSSRPETPPDRPRRDTVVTWQPLELDGKPALVGSVRFPGGVAVVAVGEPPAERGDRVREVVESHLDALARLESAGGGEILPQVSVEVCDGRATARLRDPAGGPGATVQGSEGPRLLVDAVAVAAGSGWTVSAVELRTADDSDAAAHLAVVELRDPDGVVRLGAATAVSANQAALVAAARAAGLTRTAPAVCASPWAAA